MPIEWIPTSLCLGFRMPQSWRPLVVMRATYGQSVVGFDNVSTSDFEYAQFIWKEHIDVSAICNGDRQFFF
jgi:hypothetical protein